VVELEPELGLALNIQRVYQLGLRGVARAQGHGHALSRTDALSVYPQKLETVVREEPLELRTDRLELGIERIILRRGKDAEQGYLPGGVWRYLDLGKARAYWTQAADQSHYSPKRHSPGETRLRSHGPAISLLVVGGFQSEP